MTSRAGRSGPAESRGQAGPARSSGTAGLIAIGASIGFTFSVGLAGPSVMEPALPGRPGQPPWSLGLHPSAYLVVGLTAAGLATGTLGLVLALRAVRAGWSVPPRAVLVAGLLAAAALTLVPPFGSSDHLSYAAYGRMLVTGHDPYTTTPAQLAALGDPVVRAVQDWSGSPSVYGPLATAVQGVAALVGGTSVRLTVFVLGLANLTAFTVTALLLHRMTRGYPARQLRAGLMWAANPLLLQVLVAGAHVDGQAVVFGVAAVGVCVFPGGATLPFCFPGSRISPDPRWRGLHPPVPPWPADPREVCGPGVIRCAAAGVLVGLGFAVKVTIVLVGLGLAIALVLRFWTRWRRLWPPLAALAAGFTATAATAVAIGGLAMLRQSWRASDMVSIGSPWRVIRTIIHLGVGGTAATDIVKAAAIALAAVLGVLLVRRLPRQAAGHELSARAGLDPGWYAGVAFGLALAWLFAWPYALPWYGALGWALLPLVPLLPGSAVEDMGWLLLAWTAALGFGYLPARQTDAVLPSGLAWLQPVVRHGVTPMVLTVATTWLAVLMLRSGGSCGRGMPTTADLGSQSSEVPARGAIG